jgi:hypothetical protein
VRVGQPPRHAHGDLEGLPGRGRRPPHLPRGDDRVLLAQRRHDVRRRQAARRQPHRVQPQPHRVLALAEDAHVGRARDALDLVADVQIQVVADEDVAQRSVVGIEAGGDDDGGRRLDDRDARVAHLGGQPRQRRVDPVLHVDRRQVLVPPDVERHDDVAGAVAAAGRLQVAHPLGAVDLLLQRRRDGRFDRLRVRADVDALHLDLRRRQLRILRDGQGRNADRARDDDQHRADRREDRTLDEERREHLLRAP